MVGKMCAIDTLQQPLPDSVVGPCWYVTDPDMRIRTTDIRNRIRTLFFSSVDDKQPSETKI
jgi:hypothetical protein